ncbi:YhgE/Pip domain-containing protein [Bacillus timonensis]|uniref:YhgE/Pip domain-containing protein n=1 Tax=Bacillus timonensis TaxID=1033734 RepID=A0A4S3PL93_9BACI|nr:YhgE/Pip domain-containing protein [Bacillus timonensis]THE10250.1 YhgE/Pip domain-containing protein [Bacillus timonensis]
MKLYQLFVSEIGKLKTNKAILVSVIAALLVPIVYAGILLSATWGPYDYLSNLPVAVVNNDIGAVSGDAPVNVGADLVDELKAGEDLGWDFVTSTEAMKGLQKNDYYMVIVIPEDFSQRVTSVMDPDPAKLELEYIQNEGLNFLASQVTNSAIEKIREKLANKITAEYTSQVFASLDDVADGFEKAADGSRQLADGTTQLHNGTTQLNTSVTAKMGDITKLADGTQELKTGTALLLHTLKEKSADITKLSDGSKELHAGTVTLKDGTNQIFDGLVQAKKGSEDLQTGIDGRLVPGSKKVADGTIAVRDGARQLAAGAKELIDGLEQYRTVNPTVRVGPYYQQIIDGAKKISTGLDKLSASSVGLADGADQIAVGLRDSISPGIGRLHTGLSKLVDGQQQVVAGATQLEVGAKQLADGNSQVRSGWTELTNGVAILDNGAAQISDGNMAVKKGWQTLATGTTELNNGAKQINEGSEELATGLREGEEKTSNISTGDRNIDMFSSPVELTNGKVNEYEYYRDSTAPYIITLALFVGILIMSLFIDLKKPANVSGRTWFLVKFAKLASLAFAQAVLLLVVVLLILQLSVSNLFGFIIFTILTSIVFSAIVLFLAAVGGNIGRFMALVFVVLQLSTTGANLPIEMLPDGLRALSSYLPFTYSIEGLKSLITLNDIGNGMFKLAILLGYAVIAVTLTLTVYFIKYRKERQYWEV